MRGKGANMSEKIAVLRCAEPEQVERAKKEIPALLEAKTAAERETYFGVLLNELDFDNVGTLSENGTDILDADGRYVGEMQEGDLLSWHNVDEDTYTLFEMDNEGAASEPCSFCGATGFVDTNPCQECKGTGRKPEPVVEPEVDETDTAYIRARDLEPKE